MNENDFKEIWKPVDSVIKFTHMDYAEAVTVGGQFGVLITEIKSLQANLKKVKDQNHEMKMKYQNTGAMFNAMELRKRVDKLEKENQRLKEYISRNID